LLYPFPSFPPSLPPSLSHLILSLPSPLPSLTLSLQSPSSSPHPLTPQVFVSKGFVSARSASAVRCSLRANEGTLYPLAKAFVFINKPTLILKFEDIESIEFKRYETTGAANLMRNFDLAVTLKTGGAKGDTKEFSFNLIDRAEYKPLLDFLTSKKLNIKNPIVRIFFLF
jgi:Histone chaperone Rttp106-like